MAFVESGALLFETNVRVNSVFMRNGACKVRWKHVSRRTHADGGAVLLQPTGTKEDVDLPWVRLSVDFDVVYLVVQFPL